MRVRSIDVNGDWEFGKGKSNYKTGLLAVAQNIGTSLKSFLNDCFFATDEGVDWFNLLGTKKTIELKLAIAATILKTPDVVSIEEVSTTFDSKRKILIQYSVNTIYGKLKKTTTQEV